MSVNISPVLLQYGVLGVWTLTLLWEKVSQSKLMKEERSEHVKIIKDVSTNMALVNDNLKDLKGLVSQCPTRGK
jgi:hypothetical protein